MSNRVLLVTSVRSQLQSFPKAAFGLFVFLDGSTFRGITLFTSIEFWTSLLSFLFLLVAIGLYFLLRKKQRELTVTAAQNKALEQRLIFLEQAEQAAQRTKKRFLSNLSHEIRTPLNGIIGLTYQLKKERLTDEQRMLLHDIELLKHKNG